jgi:low temperature requirement protein LtrA
MTASGVGQLLRRPDQPQRPAFLELFFDLASVVALFQLSHGLTQDLTRSGAFQTLVLLLALWWTWFSTAAITNRLDPQRPAIQLLVIATMLGTLVMAAALPEAFDRRGRLFAAVYVVIQVGRGIFLFLATRGHDVQRVSAQTLFWFVVSAVPWLVGAFAHGTGRVALWALAVAVQYMADTLHYPTPRLGRWRTSEWTVAGEHLSERYQQFFIVALGELILVSGLALGRSNFEAQRSAAFVVSFLSTVLLWRIYIVRAGELLAAAIAASPDPVRVSRFAAYPHLSMVAGIVITSVAEDLVIEHPTGHTPLTRVVIIFGGPALFLIGRAHLEYTVFGRVSRDRWIGLLALVALTPAMLLARPLLTAAAATAVLAGIAIADATRARAYPSEPPSPPRGRPS